MFDNQKSIDFSIFEKENSTYVRMLKETPLGNSEKVILLQDFLQFVSDFNSDKTVTDTGFVIPNLVRKINKGTRELCFFYFPEITVTPYCNAENLRSTSRIRKLINVPASPNYNPDFEIKIEDAVQERRGEARRYQKLSIENLKVKNVMLVTYYDRANNGTILSYNVFHTLNPGSIFQDSASASTSDSTLLFPSLMPNHYADKICWGSTHFDFNLKEYFQNDNYEGIKSIPFIYFNSLFNDDLISSEYDSMNHYKISSGLFKDIVAYYHRTIPDLEMDLNELERYMNDALLDDNSSRDGTYRIQHTVSHLMMFLGPIFSDFELYNRYFNELKNYCNTDRIHSISTYINSRLSI